jgi:ribosomal protein S18 acetylase RimI-like enzyme
MSSVSPASTGSAAMSSEQLVVRRISGVDLRAATEVFAHQQQSRGNTAVSDEVLRPAVQAALEDADRVLMVGAFHEGLPGFQHGKMVGVLMMNLLVSLEHAGEVGWIEELYVRPDYRRKALATKLLDTAMQWAQARGLRALDLELGEGSEPDAANHLYEKQGFHRIQRGRLHKRLA